MSDREKKPAGDDRGSRPVRRMVERLKFSAIAVGIVVLYLWLDPEGKLILYVQTLWGKITLLVAQNWLIYLVGLFIAWQVVGFVQKFLETRNLNREATLYPPAEELPAAHGGGAAVEKNAGGGIPGSCTGILENVRTFLGLVIVLYAVIVSILLNPVGKFMTYAGMNPPTDILELLNCVCGLGGIGVVWLAIFSIKDYFSKESRAYRDRPGFFDEMLESMRSILTPKGFEEKTSPAGLAREVTFSRGQLVVSFWYDVRDQIYYVGASSTYSLEERERVLVAMAAKSKGGGNLDEMDLSQFNKKDFSIEGTLLNADIFKSDAISRLHRWMAENNAG